MSENLPREITFDEVQVGDTIRTEAEYGGVAVTYVGVVHLVTDSAAYGGGNGVIAYCDDNITLVDRPTPRMGEL